MAIIVYPPEADSFRIQFIVEELIVKKKNRQKEGGLLINNNFKQLILL